MYQIYHLRLLMKQNIYVVWTVKVITVELLRRKRQMFSWIWGTMNVLCDWVHWQKSCWKCSSERQTHWTEGKMAMKETPVITFVFMCGIIMCWMDGKPPKLVRTLWQRDWQVIQKDCVASCPTVPKEHNAPLIMSLWSSTSTASSGSPTGRRSLQWGWLSCPTSSVPAWPSTLGRRCGAWVGRLLVRKDIKLW